MPNLWPEDFLNENRPKAPVSIVKEQAGFLGEMTNNLVVGEVRSMSRRESAIEGLPSVRSNEVFRYAFYLVAPALQNYTYRLFAIMNSITLYPVTVYWSEADEEELSAYDEDEFEELLKRIFSSQKTRQLLTAILTQSEETDDIPF